ncbi:hypothetical protein [Thiomonas sp.]|jgi:predicted DNA-binding transcriptional regulator AlpA|uniref:helix-turn-helix transcriptional regulator n=1 Tax=Thiomonas sp. TaxID=2047785 RepID=UPI002584D881|nr:hypothetical protein [Thiomonas sp.]
MQNTTCKDGFETIRDGCRRMATSRSTLYARQSEPGWPHIYKFSKKRSVLLSSEIDTFIRQRVEAGPAVRRG